MEEGATWHRKPSISTGSVYSDRSLSWPLQAQIYFVYLRLSLLFLVDYAIAVVITWL